MGEPERIFDSVNTSSELQNFIDNEPESLYVDFKEVANPDKPMKNSDDKANFAKALSGFANSNGGVLIWGVHEDKNQKGEVTKREIKSFKGVSKFIETLNDRAGKWVDPSVDGYDAKPIWTNEQDDEGAVKVIIPKSDKTPHLNREDHRFWCRSGSNFMKMELFQIDDMFGRRPKPKLEVNKREIIKNQTDGSYSLRIGIVNNGKGSAHNVYCGINALKGKVIASDTHSKVLDNDPKIFDLLFELGISTGNNPFTHPVSMPPGMVFNIPLLIFVSEMSLAKISVNVLCDDFKETPIDLYVILKNEDIIQNAEGLPKIVTYEELKSYCDLDNNPNCIEDYFKEQ